MAASHDRRKITTFGILGALGCLAGWAIGEGFLALALPLIQEEQAAPSLTSRPKEIAPVVVTQPTPPPPPQPAIPQRSVAAPACRVSRAARKVRRSDWRRPSLTGLE